MFLLGSNPTYWPTNKGRGSATAHSELLFNLGLRNHIFYLDSYNNITTCEAVEA